jgi:hypothetical protein
MCRPNPDLLKDMIFGKRSTLLLIFVENVHYAEKDKYVISIYCDQCPILSNEMTTNHNIRYILSRRNLAIMGHILHSSRI